MAARTAAVGLSTDGACSTAHPSGNRWLTVYGGRRKGWRRARRTTVSMQLPNGGPAHCAAMFTAVTSPNPLNVKVTSALLRTPRTQARTDGATDRSIASTSAGDGLSRKAGGLLSVGAERRTCGGAAGKGTTGGGLSGLSRRAITGVTVASERRRPQLSAESVTNATHALIGHTRPAGRPFAEDATSSQGITSAPGARDGRATPRGGRRGRGAR